MTTRLGTLLMALAIAALTGCNLIPPTGPSEINTRQGAEGRVRQFFLGPQSTGQLTLGTARQLLFAVSNGSSASRAESFRIQSEPSRDPHDRFRESSRAIAAQTAQEPRLRIQDVPLPPKPEDPLRKFWINSGNSMASGDHERQAKLIGEPTAHAYFFVDTESTLQRDAAELNRQVAALAEAFESVIYPRVTQNLGTPPDPGIDQDPRVYVVISPAVDNFGKDAGLMGYFWSRDLYKSSVGGIREHSNEKEVIFLTDQIFKQKPWTTFGTLAHEFTHLVVYNQKVFVNAGRAEETWLDEGLAMLAMDLSGYGLRNGNDQVALDIARYQANPEQFSLTDWIGNPKGFSYGLSYLFARYLYDRYGDGIIRDLARSPLVDVAGVEKALAPRGTTFKDVFADWSIANAISGMNLTQEPRYSYATEINLRGTYGAVQLKGIQPRPLSGPADVTGPSRPWGTAYYLLGSPQERTWTMEVRPGLGMFGGTVALP